MPRVKLIIPQKRRTPLRQSMRALWRNTSVLWREFNRPILTFAAATLGGGYLYGFLNNVLSTNPDIPPANLPYLMVALMVVETPTDMPAEPYLIVFWYAMPLIAIYIVGRGATDFVQLFFDRSGQRWKEALAMSARNHVIVLGIGHVGLRVVRALVSMGFEVVGIDQKSNPALDDELKQLRVPIILGDGREPAILEQAGIRYAQAFSICTSNDYLNLQVAMNARLLRQDLHIVARMWDSTNPLCDQIGVEVLSASELAAPAFAGAAVGIEITQSLNVHGEDYSMLRLQVAPGSFMEGQKIGELQRRYDMDIVLHGRGGDVDVHPGVDVQVAAGDLLVIFARHSQITSIAKRNQRLNNGK